MRVLIVPYPDTWQIEGGHRVQQLQTAKALRRRGVNVVIGDVSVASDRAWDVVHFFGDPSPLLHAGRPSARLVVSPVWFPAAVQLGPFPVAGPRWERAAARARQLASSVRRPRALRHGRAAVAAQLAALAQADVIVVNSEAERRLLADDAAVTALPPVEVAHSAVDSEAFEADAERGRSLIGTERFVLCVGRVEPIKNQLGLARAMVAIDRRLVLVGAVLPGNERYLARCRRACPGLLHVASMHRSELRHVYAAADVHALLSWYETTGLATLEAMAAGTPVVVGHSPCVDEYFTGCARFVDQRSIGAIRAGIRDAVEGPTGCERAHAARFSWDNTADHLMRIYGRR